MKTAIWFGGSGSFVLLFVIDWYGRLFNDRYSGIARYCMLLALFVTIAVLVCATLTIGSTGGWDGP